MNSMVSFRIRFRLRACALISICLLCGVTTNAEEALDEIIVSADFRERAAADVPASITILDSTTVEQASVQHFEELIMMVPNLNWSGDGHRARYLQIRGVGELALHGEPPVEHVVLGHIADRADFRHGMRSHRHGAHVGIPEAQKRLDERALSGSRGSDERAHLAGVQRQTHSLEDARAAGGYTHVLHQQGTGGKARRRGAQRDVLVEGSGECLRSTMGRNPTSLQ